MYFLVLENKRSVLTVHSVHQNESVAKEWLRFLEHEGRYASLAVMETDEVATLWQMVEDSHKQRRDGGE